MKNHYVLVVLLYTLLKASNCFSQNPVYKKATVSHPSELWQSLNLSKEKTNIIDGVQFYSFDTECNKSKVTLVKLINTNKYPVNLSYQLTANSPVIQLSIPASFSIEGSCSSTNENEKKLIIDSSDIKTSDKTEYVRFHISVSKQ